jgi:peptidoglycan/xylan/chitin deacetylase (PgdA/CDA1 family)
MTQPLTLRIMIGPRGEDGTFPVRASAGEAQADSALALPEELVQLGEDLLRPGVQIPALELAGIGRLLGRGLFTPRLRGMLLEQARAAAQQQARLQIQLQINVPELAALPWEWLAIGTGKPWVPALREEYTLVRIGRRARPAAPIVVEGPLRILAVGGAASGEQLAALRAALRPAIRDRLVALEVLDAPSIRDISRALARTQYHILHIAAPIELRSDERLILELGHTVEGFDLADILAEHPTMRLVALTGAASVAPQLCAAPALMGAVLMTDEIPAAMAFGTQISAEAGAQFCAALYEELADGAPLDLAATSARQALADAGEANWGAAQLRLLSGADTLFSFRAPAARLPGLQSLPIDPRRLVIPGLIVAVALIALLIFSALNQPVDPGPRPTTGPTSVSDGFVLPRFPSNLPGATATAGAQLATPEPLPPAQSYLTYTVVQSDTLDQIAARFGSSARGIAALNLLDPAAPPRPGRGIVVPVYAEGAPAATTGQIVNRANPAEPVVALTFDVEIDDKSVLAILETLRARGVRATFFVAGRWVEAFPDAARAIVRDGHELGNHSYNHPYFSRISAADAAEEIDLTERRAREVTGATTMPAFRFPYGDATADMVALLGSKGYIAYHWSTDEGGFSQWIGQAASDPDAARGAILLMHARPDNVTQLVDWLDQLADAGLRPTTLSEALR